MKLQLKVLFCSLSLALAASFAQAPAEATLTGNPVYEKNCAKCHGKSAEGRHFAGPSLKSDKVAGASDDDLRNMITNGKGHMPKFGGKLTSEEIDTLVHEIRALNKK
ncbi:MAG TPA: cytochrome c [Candidatus Acidoferrales bacterium]|nr:cytochrome c [Candidatus Acidoferrales bacterium]